MDHAHEPPEADGLPVNAAHLRLHSGDLSADFVPLRLLLQPAGATIDVDRPEVVVGRHTDADIRLPLPDVSRRHCRLQFVGGRWQVVDLNSLNGTKVNGEPVQQASLEQGDLLRIGGFTFAVELRGAAGKPGSAGHVESILQTLANTPRSRAS
jgi:pSer/pThr/pTyr-binding forkhead associated (FHA) protein